MIAGICYPYRCAIKPFPGSAAQRRNDKYAHFTDGGTAL